MRLPNTAHTSRPWRIHELTRDFRLEDVWALPTPGGQDDFPRLVQLIASGNASQGSKGAARALWVIRLKLGELLGWDERPDADPMAEQPPSLRDRLPADLRACSPAPHPRNPAFTPLYLTADEWAAEIINHTVHGVLHLGWVPDRPDRPGRYHGQLAVYVKPNGPFGTAYMAAIKPFRHLIVYPEMTRQLARAWSTPTPAAAPAPQTP
jgi:Protein of unknown function (DUF2867)